LAVPVVDTPPALVVTEPESLLLDASPTEAVPPVPVESLEFALLPVVVDAPLVLTPAVAFWASGTFLKSFDCASPQALPNSSVGMMTGPK
jgi:hypothetical protein